MLPFCLLQLASLTPHPRHHDAVCMITRLRRELVTAARSHTITSTILGIADVDFGHALYILQHLHDLLSTAKIAVFSIAHDRLAEWSKAPA